MYKDKNGNCISEYSVVLLRKNLYTVIGFDSSRQCSVALANGFVISQAIPEELVCVDNIDDIKNKL